MGSLNEIIFCDYLTCLYKTIWAHMMCLQLQKNTGSGEMFSF